MKKYIYLFCSICMMAFVGCTNADKEHDHDEHEGENHGDEIHFTRQQAESADLQEESVELGTLKSALKVSGLIQSPPGDEYTVSATAAGIVSLRNGLTEGTQVRNGEVLAVVSSKNLQEGDPVDAARLTYEAAEREYRRAEKLIADKIISAKEFEQIKLAYETAKTAYNAQSNHRSGAGVNLTSGISGFVKQLLVSPGSYVDIGTPIAVISQTKRLQLKADVPENQYRFLQNVGDANFITSYDNGNVHELSKLNGRLVSRGKNMDDNTSYIPVIFEFDNVGDIIPGSFADVYLLSTARENVISVPVSALMEQEGTYYVYVRKGDEEFLKREVKIGETDGARVEILSGLNVGDKVVTNGAYQIKLASLSGEIPEGHSH